MKAEDGKNSRSITSLSDTTSVLVYIIDENDNGPIFDLPSYTFHVLENATISQLVGQVGAKDEDAGLNGKLTYSISAGNSGDR